MQVAFDFGDGAYCDDGTKIDSVNLLMGWPTKGETMSERDWEEEKRSVLSRLFDAAFGRHESSDDEMGRDIHWLGTVNRHLDDDDD